jgi:hypothetical protein
MNIIVKVLPKSAITVAKASKVNTKDMINAM